MQALIVLTAVGNAAGAINSIYQFAKNVQEFFGDPTDENRQRYLATLDAIRQVREVIMQAATEILSAIEAFKVTEFRADISEQLGLADTALQTVDAWRQTRNDDLRALALRDSTAAVATMLRYVSTKAYLPEALIFHFVEILTSRMAVLAEADRTFGKSAVARRPIEDGISRIRDTATQIETAIREQNQIRQNRKTARRRDPDGGWTLMVSVSISYYNLSGTVSFSRDFGPFEGSDESEAVQQALAEAQIERARGITEDLTAAKLAMLRDSADRIEQSLRASELA